MNAVGHRINSPMITMAQLLKMVSVGIILKSKADPMHPKSSGRITTSHTTLTSSPIFSKKSVPEHCVHSITRFCSQISLATVPIKRVPTAPLPSNPARLYPNVINRPSSIAIAVRCQGYGQYRAAANTTPLMQPDTMPRNIDTGPYKNAASAKLLLLSIAIPIQMVKPVIATMSSKAHAAMTSDGIPFSTPYPNRCRLVMPGTTIAGDTAAKMKPSDRANRGGIPKIQ
mmetsp:Transcript_11255/g.23996  ORF Transcript_11255/g.23996 Transcript_11255/m.23996 type:complete len:228 (-) Transcript_11255:621-1304(-)